MPDIADLHGGAFDGACFFDEFSAYEGELNGWFYDTGQYFNPDATWGPDRETWPLTNERTT